MLINIAQPEGNDKWLLHIVYANDVKYLRYHYWWRELMACGYSAPFELFTNNKTTEISKHQIK